MIFAAVLAATVLAVCGDGEAAPLASEEGAVVLVETQPQSLARRASSRRMSVRTTLA